MRCHVFKVNVYEFAFYAQIYYFEPPRMRWGWQKRSHHPSHPGSPLERPGLTSVSFMNARLHSDWPSNRQCLLPMAPISTPISTFANSIASSIPHKTPCHTKCIVWLSRHIEPRPVDKYLSGVANNLELMLPDVLVACRSLATRTLKNCNVGKTSAIETCSSEFSCQS